MEKPRGRSSGLTGRMVTQKSQVPLEAGAADLSSSKTPWVSEAATSRK